MIRPPRASPFSASVLVVLVAIVSQSPAASAQARAPGAGALWGNDVELRVESNSPERTTLTYNIRRFDRDTVMIGGRPYLKLSIDHAGFALMDQAGQPQVPALCRSLIIPDEARMDVRLIASDYDDIEGADLAPYRGLIPRNIDPDTVPYRFGEAYSRDAFFPGDLVTLRAPYILHDVRGIVVEVFPLQWNPVSRRLRVYRTIEVEVNAAGPGGLNVLDRRGSPRRDSRSFELVYANQFANYAGARSRLFTEPPLEDGEMLIICYGPYMTAMQPFVTWKSSRGMNTMLVDVATIGNTFAAIMNYVTSVYNSSNLAYLLLVGDAGHVASGRHMDAVSDPSYSTLTGDSYPDIFVGRFSAQSEGDVATQVQRTIEYEQAGHSLSMGGWNAKAVGIASEEGAGIGHYGEADNVHEDLLRDELLSAGFTQVDRIYDPFGTKEMVIDALNEGRRLVNYTGHGYSGGWGTTGFSSGDINDLTNVGMLPFVHSVACLGGDFDNGTVFGEAWLRATHEGEPTGAIAAYCSSVNQYWDPPMYCQCNHAYNTQCGAAERFYTELNWSLGGCWFGGACTMMDIAGSGGRDMFLTWHVFGDPSVRLIDEPPLALSLPEGRPERVDPGLGARIAVEIAPGKESYVPGTGKVHYRYDQGAFVEADLVPLGGDRFDAVLPNTRPGDEPEYYLSALGSGGTTVYLPPGGAGEPFDFDVAFVEVLLADDFESDLGWTVQDTDLQTGAWERGDPTGTSAQPEDDHSDPGTLCYVTDRRGGSSGDYDVDGGPTRLTSPAIDLSAGGAEVSFYLWFYHSTYGTQQPCQVHVSNNFGITWTKVMDVANGPAWNLFSFAVADYVPPTPGVMVRFSVSDNPNDDVVEAVLDDFEVERWNRFPSLWADAYSISAATGGVVHMSLDAGGANGNRTYLVLGSVTGTSPGFSLPGGTHVPLNWDIFTSLIVSHLSSPAFAGFYGPLDGTGQGAAVFDTVGPVDPIVVGIQMHFAYLLAFPPAFDFVSNPIAIAFEP
ncbi:MAG: C25 family cysteine peptidase [Planctomycetota bacterium]